MPDWSKSGLWGAAAGGFPRTTKAVVHGSSSFAQPVIPLPPSSIVRTINAGVLTNAGQLYTVLRVTGAGEFTNLGLSGADVNARQPRLRVTCDGTVAFDVTGTNSGGWNGQVLPATIQNVASGSGFFLPPISFTLSCLVEISSSVAADNGINLWYSLRSF